ncbi:MAG: gamma-glutamyl-gamma-aminobutyrate hydrolase family protein [Thermomicrobiales bacterium]|nr:gamma-glutamyl-gamma-aminobutyrate hydrolase family protein [Thermomicrobiales bacterium]
MKRPPVIGITAGLMTDVQDSGTVIRHRVSADYSNAVRAAGGLPIILPPQEGTIDSILDMVDGLIFSGGADIDPARYGATDVHPATYDISLERDRFELDLFSAAVERDLPILCICRGIQVLNVALGGTLLQHIDDQIDQPLAHRQAEIGKGNRETSHDVALANGSLSAAVFESTLVPANSFHHQSLDAPAPAVHVDGLTSDGVIEAVSVPSCSFVLGVQWHPELLYEAMPIQLKPFEALVAAARTKTLEPAGA